MSQSAVSRQVSALERDLKVVLFHRHARGLVLTEQGELLHRTTSDVISKLHTAETLLSDTTSKPTGELRITAPVGFGTVWLTQRLREFHELYPEIRVELLLNDDQIDIGMRAADVAIWTREPGADRPHPPRCCSQAGCAPSLRPNTSAASARRRRWRSSTGHRIVSYAGQPAQHLTAITWIETVGRDGKGPREPAFRANSVVALRYAIRSGIGIGMIPDYMTDEQADLVPVLTEIDPPTLPILFVYPEELKSSKKVQVLRDFLVAKARQWKY